MAELRKEAVQQKKIIKPDLFDYIFSSLRPDPFIIRMDRSQTKVHISFAEYRAQRDTPQRIKDGYSAYLGHKKLLDKISADYGVDARFIVGLWGMETHYGKVKGRYPTIRALATLAYDARRSDFFRSELLYALHILNVGAIKYKDFVGSWDGGMGHPQFMPSSWYNFAQDYDKDRKRDIWSSHSDAFASIANYLKMHGWQYHAPYFVEVILPGNFDHSLLGVNVTKPVHEWLKMGVKVRAVGSRQQREQFTADMTASVLALPRGPTLMVFNNYKVILLWNRLNYFAATLGYLSSDISAALCGSE